MRSYRIFFVGILGALAVALLGVEGCGYNRVTLSGDLPEYKGSLPALYSEGCLSWGRAGYSGDAGAIRAGAPISAKNSALERAASRAGDGGLFGR